MFPLERRKRILKLLEAKNTISVNEAAFQLNVSKPTIRSDFDYIAKENPNVERTHGGVILLNEDKRYTKYEDRSTTNIIEKRKIANEAFKLIENKTTLLLDSSSTCYELSQLILESDLQVTVITNGLNTSMSLKENPNITVILIGGVLKARSNTTQDEFDNSIFDYFDVDTFFFSASSVSIEAGFTDYNLSEIKTKKNYITKARKTVALIDSSKFNDPSNSSFAKLENIDLLVTDDKISDYYYNSFSKKMNVIKAS